ncbi:IS701 family transposase, partial [Clostridium sp. SM-530-WT-3G]|nr:IS701 family transposase [Clostridium sp. SM-530-WT-3G]
ELFRVKYGKLYKLKNIGDVIIHFRNNYLVKIVAFAHECADNGISLESTISKLGLVA